MIAESLGHVRLNCTVFPVLPSMLSIDEDAKYYSLLDKHVCLHISTNEQVDDVKEKDGKHVIDNKVYRSLATNKLDYFLEKENE